MEETDNKLTYEQLEMIAKQLNHRAMQAEARLASINMTQMRLDYLFKVLDRKEAFRPEFINKCALDIEELLSVEPQEDTEE